MKNVLVSLVIGGLSLNAYSQATPSLEELWQLVQEQQAKIESLEKQLAENDEQLAENQEQIKETQVIAVSVADVVENQQVVSGQSSLSGSWADKTSIGGYGEHHYNIFDESSDQIDAHRYVIYFAHQYTDTLRFFSEWELEHSLAGEGKPGEVELEQAFIEWQYHQDHNLKAGLFLLPAGILNETHEPDTFYGVERNKVESEVIPSTWWETGAMLSGSFGEGFSYDTAVHSGLFVENFRIRSGRQKSAEAVADALAFTGRLKYTGVPGLEIATTLQYQSDLTQDDPAYEKAPAFLLEGHVAYQGERFGIRALAAAWDIDSEEFADAGADDPWGAYIEPSFKVTESLGLFTRYSILEPARGDRPAQETESVDIGLNYWLNPQVVFKADYQDNLKDGEDSFNLGVGWSY